MTSIGVFVGNLRPRAPMDGARGRAPGPHGSHVRGPRAVNGGGRPRYGPN